MSERKSQLYLQNDKKDADFSKKKAEGKKDIHNENREKIHLHHFGSDCSAFCLTIPFSLQGPFVLPTSPLITVLKIRINYPEIALGTNYYVARWE